jgi:hydroxypyruvate isomerase
MERRYFLPAFVTAGLAAAQISVPARIVRKGRLRQSCFDRVFGAGMPLEDMCREASRLGAVGFDAQPPEAWSTLKRFGLTPTLARGGGISIEAGIIHEQLHSDLVSSLGELIDLCAENGCPSILIVGGQRNGMSYAEGAYHAAAFLNRVKSHAEQKNVTLCLEVMNSKYADPAFGRKDQVCDHLDWAVELCTRVNSPRVKILFDIYHVQIMDGNIIANIQACLPLIGHFHTGGVPGRHEIDETQELNYGLVFRTIAELGYRGVIAHEYDPTPGRDPVRSLEKVFAITDV